MPAQRKPKNNDSFSFGSFDLGLDRLSKSSTLASNRMRGRMAENSFALEQHMQGHDVKRIHKGGDFVVQKRDIFGRKTGKPTTYEIKTGNAQLSDAQKKRKKRSPKGRYKILRY